MSRKSIVISSGDPAGCGPFITLKAIDECGYKDVDFFVVGDKKIFRELSIYQRVKKHIKLVDLDTSGITGVKKGTVSRLAGKAGLSYLDKSLALIKKMRIKRLVTAPLSKEAVKFISRKFSGHTEYLANYFKVKNYAMMMVSSSLKVVLSTRHILLREVSFSLRKKDIYNLLYLVDKSLRYQFRVRNPRIVLCAVNPHAGINTFLEREEKKILAAKLEFKRSICGPYPADTIFTKKSLKQYDCVICAYHDQAMIPFKLLSFHDGVNITLGLPIVRTSPAHGVAYDLVKKGKKPFHSSMTEAIKLALKLAP